LKDKTIRAAAAVT